MTNEQAARVFYRAFETGDLGSLDTVFVPDWRDNTLPPGRAPGLDGMKSAIASLRSAMPDLACAVNDIVIGPDKLVARITFTGTSTGAFLGAPPSGRRVTFIAFDMHRMRDGRIIESWHLEDNLTALIGMGVLPPLGGG